MSEERLSKLQKFILVNALKYDDKVFRNTWIAKEFWGRENVYYIWPGGVSPYTKKFYPSEKTKMVKNKYRVSVSRSIKNLEDKCLIEENEKGCLVLTFIGKRIALLLTVPHC